MVTATDLKIFRNFQSEKGGEKWTTMVHFSPHNFESEIRKENGQYEWSL